MNINVTLSLFWTIYIILAAVWKDECSRIARRILTAKEKANDRH